MGKYGRARQATDDNIIRIMRITCWITKTSDKQSEYVINYVCPLLHSTYLHYNSLPGSSIDVNETLIGFSGASRYILYQIQQITNLILQKTGI